MQYDYHLSSLKGGFAHIVCVKRVRVLNLSSDQTLQVNSGLCIYLTVIKSHTNISGPVLHEFNVLQSEC